MLLQKWSNIFHDDNTVCLPPVHNYHVLEKTGICRLSTTTMFWKKPASASCPQLPMFWKKTSVYRPSKFQTHLLQGKAQQHL